MEAGVSHIHINYITIILAPALDDNFTQSSLWNIDDILRRALVVFQFEKQGQTWSVVLD